MKKADKQAFDLLLELIQLQFQRQVLLADWPELTVQEIDARIFEIKERLTGDAR